MIFKIVNYLVLGIALFYVAEDTGLIEKNKYFPTLPRLDARASDPMAWLGAAEWGITHAVGMANGNARILPPGTARQLSISGPSSFTERLNRQRDATQKLLSSYYNGG
jgi:hypothetical protein